MWGISSVLIKVVIEEVGSPFVAAFISFVAASLVIGALLFRKGQRDQLTRLGRPALISLTIAGVFVAVGQLFRYLAISYSPVSVVAPLTSTFVLFVFPFSFFFSRSIEVFTWRILIGMVAIVAGTFLLFR